MSGYAVDMAELQQVDALLEQCAGHARAALAGLTGTAHGLLGSGWSSPAGTAFRLGWQDWAEAAGAALTALEAMGRSLGSAAAGYDGTDAAVRSAVAGASA